MTATQGTANLIHDVLGDLIKQKSLRDQRNFTSSQLANALSVPRSLISRLLHPDPTKRVTNPTAETLKKIVNFFRADGFDITVDDLLGISPCHAVPVAQDNVPVIDTLPLYCLDDETQTQSGEIKVCLANPSGNLIALRASEDVKPIFKAGSLFIVNKDLPLADNILLAIRLPGKPGISLRKYTEATTPPTLHSYDPQQPSIALLPTMVVDIVGVVVQVNAKT